MNAQEGKREILVGLAWGGIFVALALIATFARKMGYIEQETVTRVVSGSMGLMVAWFGNRLPKSFVPYAWAREVRRVAGWSQVLSGLAYAGLWAFAPLDVAVWAGIAAILAGIAVTIGYCFVVRSKAKPTPNA